MTAPIVATANPAKIVDEISCRLMIGTFMFLCWKLTGIILSPVSDGDVQLLLLTLSEIPVMVVLALLFGKRNVTQDIIEFNFYGMIAHAIAIPAYLYGIESTYHNNAIKILWCLTIIRLIYIGPKNPQGTDFKGLPVFGVVGHVRQWVEESQQSKANLAFQYSAHVLFFGAALPLWFIMIRSNDLFVSSTIVVLMLFVFFMANHWHNKQLEAKAENTSLRRELDALKRNQLFGQHETGQVSVRDVATQLVDSYKRTHPSMQNLNTVIAKYVERNFPDESTFNPSSISARRAKAATQLAELIFIAKDQLSRNAQSGNTHDDIARLTAKFDESLQFRLDETGMIAFMDYVMGQPPLEVSDTTFLLACDVLTTGWMRCLLSVDAASFQEEYSRLELMTREFVARFMPWDESLENE